MVRSVACPAIECVEKRSKWEKTIVGGGNLDEKVELDKPGRVTADEVEMLCGVESRKRFEWLKEKIRVESGELRFLLSSVALFEVSHAIVSRRSKYLLLSP